MLECGDTWCSTSTTPAIDRRPLTQHRYVEDSLVHAEQPEHAINTWQGTHTAMCGTAWQPVPLEQAKRLDVPATLPCMPHPCKLLPKHTCTRPCMPVRYGSTQHACLPCVRQNQRALHANAVPHYVEKSCQQHAKEEPALALVQCMPEQHQHCICCNSNSKQQSTGLLNKPFDPGPSTAPSRVCSTPTTTTTKKAQKPGSCSLVRQGARNYACCCMAHKPPAGAWQWPQLRKVPAVGDNTPATAQTS